MLKKLQFYRPDKDQKLIATGNYPALLTDVEDIEMTYDEKTSPGQHWKFEIEFEDASPYRLSRRVRNSLTPKSDLTKILIGLVGQKVFAEVQKDDERIGKLINSFIGHYFMIKLIHSEPDKSGRVWANIADISNLPPGMPRKIQKVTLNVDEDIPEWLKGSTDTPKESRDGNDSEDINL